VWFGFLSTVYGLSTKFFRLPVWAKEGINTAMNQVNPNTNPLPSYVANAIPNPPQNRAPWYKNTAPTYAGIFLWFVFWQDAGNAPFLGGTLSSGVLPAIVALVLSALVCHALFFLVPGLLGMKTGLPLYIVGTSTFGTKGGFIMPGFLMGLLQFGWLAVNIYFSSLALGALIPSVPPQTIMIVWGVLAAFMGLKGIQYVAKVATYLPLIPLAILIILFAGSASGLSKFSPEALINTHKTLLPATAAPMGVFAMIAFLLTYVVGFFATAGAAGVDFGSGNRDARDVHAGGFVGIALAITFTAIMAVLIVAGVHGSKDVASYAKQEAATVIAQKEKDGSLEKDVTQAFAEAQEKAKQENKPAPEKAEIEKAVKDGIANNTYANIVLKPTGLAGAVVGAETAKWFGFLLALAAFPAACFSSLIAANSFKTTLSGVNPFLSVGIGAAVSILLAISGLAGKVVPVFVIIGASFGPICGAMAVDYVLSGRKWAGPRAGFNPAGWLAWGFGFLVGIMPNIGIPIPAAPVLAFVVGAVAYFLAAKAGLESPVIPMPTAKIS
jgi:cytosine permease